MFVDDKPTYHKLHVHSLIDHIYSNCVGKINNLTTIDNGMSDHSLIKFNYNTKFNNLKPKFMYRRDKHLLTTHTLTQYIDHNDRLNEIFSLDDPDQIANILLSELNLIINCIAPKKRIQVKTKFAPFIDKELRTAIDQKKIYTINL